MNVDKVIKILEKEVRKYNSPVIELIEKRTRDPFKVLVSTILSSRTKDEVTIKAAERLFSKIKRPKDFERIHIKELEKIIYPVGFYKTKAKHLKKLASYLEKGIPNNIEELIKLPGVGRKTANLVLSVAFKKDAICVDTHVHRITNRWGYVKTKTAEQTEMELRKKLPKKYWRKINTLLVAFGQNTCKPISPYCSKCSIREYCRRIGVNKSR